MAVSRTISRWWRRLRGGVGGADARFVYHPAYSRTVLTAPLDPLRADRILSFLLERGMIRRSAIDVARPASLENLLRIHDRDYLRGLERPDVVGDIVGATLSPEEAARILSLQRLIVGGTIQTTRLALRDPGPAIHLGGGLHHAAPDRGMGFCLLNDVAVAIARLRAHHFDAPVVVVDLDLHDGNGTRAAFADDASVFTFSIHNQDWDDADAVASASFALGTGVDDEGYLRVLRAELPPVLRTVRPGLVLYLAGTDPARDDPLGDWEISPEAMLERDRFVVRTARAVDPAMPLAIVLAGGYGAASWRASARFFSWLLGHDPAAVADNLELALDRFRRIRGELVGGEGDAAGDDAGDAEGWPAIQFGEEDFLAAAGGFDTTARLLGRLSRAEVERSLEGAGILDHLRRSGYHEPEVELASGALGDTVRVFGEPGREALLIELRLARDREAVPPLELLWVEWLLLQDPARSFATRRHRLPGQEHPGLGILGEVVGWLVILAEALELDGIGFRSSLFHIARLAREHFRFADPEREALYQRLLRVLEPLDPGRASAALAGDRVVDRETGEPVHWPTACMVLPLSERALERTAASVAVEAGAEPPRFRLVEEPPDG